MAEESGTRFTLRSSISTTDNIAVVAGMDSSRHDLSNTIDLLNELSVWLDDYHPTAVSLGYVVLLLGAERLDVYSMRNLLLGSFQLAHKMTGLFGAYSIFIEKQNDKFYDMTRISYTLKCLDPDIPDHDVSPRDIIDPAQQHKLDDLMDAHATNIKIVYHVPPGRLLGVIALNGARGLLENYGDDEAINAHVHKRNVATVKATVRAYRGYLADYLRNVDAAKKEDDILKQGPPRRPYGYPIPEGATDSQAVELSRANTVSDLPAWMAVVDKLNKLADLHAEGALYFTVKLSLVAPKIELGPFELSWDNLKVSTNIDVGTDGVLIPDPKIPKLDILAAMVPKAGAFKTKIWKDSTVGVELERQGDTITKTTVNYEDPKGLKVSISDDGTRSITLPNGGKTSINVQTGESGLGYSRDLKVSGKKVGSIYLGLGMQANREETVVAFADGAYSLWPLRSNEELLADHTQWNDLDSFEQQALEVLEWDQYTFDRKRTLSLKELPEPCHQEYYELTYEQKLSARRLLFKQAEWPGVWSKIAKQPLIDAP